MRRRRHGHELHGRRRRQRGQEQGRGDGEGVAQRLGRRQPHRGDAGLRPEPRGRDARPRGLVRGAGLLEREERLRQEPAVHLLRHLPAAGRARPAHEGRGPDLALRPLGAAQHVHLGPADLVQVPGQHRQGGVHGPILPREQEPARRHHQQDGDGLRRPLLAVRGLERPAGPLRQRDLRRTEAHRVQLPEPVRLPHAHHHLQRRRGLLRRGRPHRRGHGHPLRGPRAGGEPRPPLPHLQRGRRARRRVPQDRQRRHAPLRLLGLHELLGPPRGVGRLHPGIHGERPERLPQDGRHQGERPVTRIVLSLALLASCLAPAWAANSNVGTSAAQFLKLGAGSRAGAMGEAYSALADDVYAVYYNPAGLVRMRGSQLAAGHAEHFQGISYEFAGFGYPVKDSSGTVTSAFGGAIYNLSVADIERRSADTRSPTGNFTAGDYSYNLSYARLLTPKLSLGVTGKVVQETIDSYSASAFAMDFGAQYTLRNALNGRPVVLSGLVKNVGTEMDFAGVSDPLPRAVVLGAGAAVANGVRVAVDATKYRDTDLFFGVGAEYLYPFTDNVDGALRAGLNTHRADNDGMNLVTFGAGVNFYRAGFDFAWVPYGDLGNTFRFSLLLKF
ncbi:PorV/PorQ family protein [bacterium]|nr:MAG: PorV/PorQ family protein [bacterium]